MNREDIYQLISTAVWYCVGGILARGLFEVLTQARWR